MERRRRNNISRLPASVRERFCELIIDGVGYDGIKEDPAIKKECITRKIRIHNSSILAFKNSEEYEEIKRYVLSRKRSLTMNEVLLLDNYRKLNPNEQNAIVEDVIARARVKKAVKAG